MGLKIFIILDLLAIKTECLKLILFTNIVLIKMLKSRDMLRRAQKKPSKTKNE